MAIRIERKALNLNLFCLVLTFFSVTFTSSSHATLIDFEGFPDSTVLTNQITDLSFTNTKVITAGISLNEFEFPPNSGENVVFDSGGPITITFLAPVSYVGGYFTYTTPVTITAFDASSDLIGSIISQFSTNTALSGDVGSSPNELISVSFSGISKVIIEGDSQGGSFVMDDLTFLPEPGTAMLICSGLGLMVVVPKIQRRRRITTRPSRQEYGRTELYLQLWHVLVLLKVYTAYTGVES